MDHPGTTDPNGCGAFAEEAAATPQMATAPTLRIPIWAWISVPLASVVLMFVIIASSVNSTAVNFAAPVIDAAQANARLRSCWANQRTIEGAEQAFAATNEGRLRGSVGELVSSNYLKTAPVCPSGGSGYTIDADGVVSGDTGRPESWNAGHSHY